jgi:hypothetical protein
VSGVLRILLFAGLCLAATAAAANCSVVAGNPQAAADSRYQRSEPVSGQPVVRDLVSGLVWQGCEAGRDGPTCADGAASTFDWSAALQHAAASSYAGFDDWRLPNAVELASLIETGCAAPMLNTTLFPVDEGAAVWSATARARPLVSTYDQAWAVNFASGIRSSLAKSSTLRVRLVRDGGLAAFDAGRDFTPDSLSLAARTARPRSQLQEFGPLNVSGIDTPVGIAISGAGSPSYAINGGAYTSAPGMLRAGDQVRVRHTSASTAGTTVSSLLRIGPLQVEARSVTASDDAALASLSVDGLALSPAFQSTTLAYTAAAPNALDSIRVTAGTASAAAALTIAGAAATSGVPSAPIALAPGANAVVIDVLAEDGVTARRYTLSVQRALASTSTSLSTDAASVLPGQPVSVTAVVAGDAPSGSVRFLANGSEIAGCAARALAATSPPAATCTVAGLPAGTVTLRGEYAGDAANLPSSAELLLSVNTPPTLSLAATASLDEDATLPLLIDLADAETAAGDLQLTVSAADPTLFDAAALTAAISGAGASRLLPLAARPDAFGRSTLTLAVEDPQGGRSEATVEVDVLAVNDPPSATVLPRLQHPPGSMGAQARDGVATALAVGPPNEAAQVLSFDVREVSDSNDVLSAAAMDAGGRLSYQLSGRAGVARLAVVALDDGGVQRGGRDRGETHVLRVFVGPGSDLETRVVRLAPSRPDLPQAILDGVQGGEYRLQVLNHGPLAVPAVRVSGLAARGLADLLWQCEPPAACQPANGAGQVQLDVPLAVDEALTVVISGRYRPQQFALELQVAASAAPGLLVGTDDDRRVLLEPLHPSIIFLSGFD